MRLMSVLRKTIREQLRDFWTLLLTLSLGPFFVLFYWVMFGGGSTTYDLLIINHDAGASVNGGAWSASNDTIKALHDVNYQNGQGVLKIKLIEDRKAAEKKLKDRQADMLVVFPEDYSRSLLAGASAASQIEIVGDLSNPYYSVVSVVANAAMSNYLQTLSGESSPVTFKETALGDSAARSEFETWVPGLFIMAAVLLIYQTSMTIAREIESGTVRRLQMTPMTAFDLMGGVSLSQILIGVIGVLITFLTAVACGFHSEGPLWIAILLGGITSMAMVGVGLIVACFSRTIARAFMISNFPLFLMTFFSGMFMPISTVPLFKIAGRTIGLLDLLPPTHAVTAINKVTALGAGFGDIIYELAALSVLSMAYFLLGVWLFQRRHLRRA
ncbi:MAG TPA: ABC transporter permease [Aggregatilineaceae bacterium]|nr:ABC transporter permease [Aggregatilineaceae bacterium]